MRYTKIAFGSFLFSSFVLLSGCTPPPPPEEAKNKEVPQITQQDLKKGKSSPQKAQKTETENEKNNSSKDSNMSKKRYDTPPEMQIDKSKEYTAILKTNKGDITVTLFAEKTPITVNNFIFLSREGFYDNTIFHRIINGFMIQGGDPTRTGGGGPGYKFDDEPFSGKYKRGTVAMANAGANTNGSQFFIMHEDNELPPNYVIFGEVLDGIDVVDIIATSPVESSASGEQSSPTEITLIEEISIREE